MIGLHVVAVALLVLCLDGTDAQTGPRVLFGPDADPSGISALTDFWDGEDVPSQLLSVHFPMEEELRSNLRDELFFLASQHPANMEGTHFDLMWRSSNPIWEQSGHPAIREIVDLIEDRLHNVLGRPAWYVHKMWAIISEEGMTGDLHMHQGIVAGVYYIDAGESSRDNGALIWYPTDRRKEKKEKGKKKRSRQITTVPQTGMMLMWQSELYHRVSVYTSSVPRIVISFNIFEGKPESRHFWLRPEIHQEDVQVEVDSDAQTTVLVS
uniref:Prolyl 4-hydroxylase alpha subunit Fe(2+) 2OG dioxygenase domain-containing protein n=1 Tax=Chromera velia CCMP2878 TaxID=1169474 RepID=A0A0G4HI89_9ALVE|eukprot:Cvel_27816.t1-p1 / transcript=Cvel_27816.t1 / gene=Cvel_27816 / organism=Chromera_velia_CCMP2878 / gene_product=hypothetical protein / transcript_product=hypothetical protein / location=Cvel_scaffold3532:15063-15860(+) / protein_length=266 / sequence_SO=supercontig / SO=protein_coding / is_pseudo=false